ncbi:hypothetical protein CANINC_003571 [Pichia inconspicua]|uniref:PAN2-PAN3 deadenylation complex subunit PAN3 n=1 Tax=Pichia inconspicua TaxID=52247 RepID=A0A4T0WYB7_9ASCO|nr:hypothetical protein CANINC_003571 [[Candida] inconspicua]
MPSSAQFDWAKNIPCRNIQIHGFCKFEHKGCSYNHDLKNDTFDNNKSNNVSSDETNENKNEDGPLMNQQDSRPDISPPLFKPALSKNLSMDSASRFKVDSPSFTPTAMNKFVALSPSLETIPSFVPSKSESSNLKVTPSSPSSIAPTVAESEDKKKAQENSPLNDYSSLRSTLTQTTSFNPTTAPVFTPVTNLSASTGVADVYNPSAEEPFYQNTNLFPVNFLLYAPPPPPHIALNKKANERTVDDLFIDSSLRKYLQLKNEESLKAVSNNELDLPSHVDVYHSLYPIDHNFNYSSKSFGYTSMVYKCMSNDDGRLYTMRRLQNVPITSASVLKSIKKWKKLDCANCVKVYDVFTTRAFNDNSLILIYDYFPMSLTLLENHFMSFPNKDPELITENCLWSYTIQLLNAVTEVSNLKLSVGSLDPSKIIITNKGRIRLSALSIDTILNDVRRSKEDNTQKESEPDLTALIQKDLLSLGKLILFLAKSTTVIQSKSEDPREIILELKYSTQFKNMLLYLFSENPTLEAFQSLLAPMMLKVINSLQSNCDVMESTLSSELENARLVRLFAKLDFICERPEMVQDGSWSETGERYPIKLFKDYVFHQVDETGKPVVDLTHVITCLNKLDAGVEENILLVSPDEMTCLIISYKDLKELINKSFMKLLGKA